MTGGGAGVAASAERMATGVTGCRESTRGATEETGDDVHEGNADASAAGGETSVHATEGGGADTSGPPEGTTLDLTDGRAVTRAAGSPRGAEQSRVADEAAEETARTSATAESGEELRSPITAIDAGGGAAGGALASEVPEDAAKSPAAAESGEEVMLLAASEVSADTAAALPTVAAEAVEESASTAAAQFAGEGVSIVTSVDAAVGTLHLEGVVRAASTAHGVPGAAGIALASTAVDTAGPAAGEQTEARKGVDEPLSTGPPRQQDEAFPQRPDSSASQEPRIPGHYVVDGGGQASAAETPPVVQPVNSGQFSDDVLAALAARLELKSSKRADEQDRKIDALRVDYEGRIKALKDDHQGQIDFLTDDHQGQINALNQRISAQDLRIGIFEVHSHRSIVFGMMTVMSPWALCTCMVLVW
jgi:hypothetical protein